jgi:hypothetical protein
MEIWEVLNFAWSLVTFRNVAPALCCLPLLTMTICLSFFKYLSKTAREWVTLFGLLGFVVNVVLVVEAAFRTFGVILEYLTQKPQLVYDSKSQRMANYNEPF